MKKVLVLLLAAVALLLGACGNSQAEAKPLADIFNDIKAQVSFENITELSSSRLMGRYYGITDEMAAEFAGCINASGVSQEEIVLVKAVDERASAEIKEKLDNRYQSKLQQNKNYNPEQAAIIENCTVDQDGLYVSMIVSDKAAQIKEIYRKEAGLE